MNVTESFLRKTFALTISQHKRPSGWSEYAFRAVLLIGLCTYVLFFRKRDVLRGRKWFFQRKKRLSANERNDGNVVGIKYETDASMVRYNGEVCPICLCAPTIGVRASCGHVLCARCLVNYDAVKVTPAPPPCPLCRAPLDSIALACDFTAMTTTVAKPDVVADVTTWIDEYNFHCGLAKPRKSRSFRFLPHGIMLIDAFVFIIPVGLVVLKLQAPPCTDWILDSVIDIAWGIAIIACLWLKHNL